MTVHHRALLTLAPLVAFGLAACASGPPPAPPVPQIAGSYAGSMSVQGDQFFGTLTIEQNGTALDLTFSFPDLALTARGDGQIVEDEVIRAEVSYTINCPGVATFDGRIEDDERVLAGTFQAQDCESALTGSFRFTRRN